LAVAASRSASRLSAHHPSMIWPLSARIANPAVVPNPAGDRPRIDRDAHMAATAASQTPAEISASCVCRMAEFAR
jgi:hypothetical protein